MQTATQHPSGPPPKTSPRAICLAAALLFNTAWLCPAAAEPVPVRTIELASVLQEAVASAPGTVVAHNQPQLAAEIDARVVELPREVGEAVGAGDLVARLDCRRHQSALSAAQGELARARVQQGFSREQLVRARNLKKNNSISDELLDQRRTELAVSEAETLVREQALQRARIDVDACELRAPFDAVVTARPVSVGSFVNRGNAVVSLLETSGQEISVALRHEQVSGLQDAATPVFESDGKRYPVRLRTLLPLADSVARTREARLSFVGESAIAGTAGRVVWQGATRLLPPDYLVRRDGQLGVFVLDHGRAHFIAIQDAQEGRPSPLALPPDTRLITDGRQRLNDGDEVAPIAAAEQP